MGHMMDQDADSSRQDELRNEGLFASEDFSSCAHAMHSMCLLVHVHDHAKGSDAHPAVAFSQLGCVG